MKILIDLSVVENIIKYCEDKQVYDKLGAYGDFYYKAKKAVFDSLPEDDFKPKTDNVLSEWQELARIVDNIAYKVFQKTIGDNIPEKGFREIFPVIESKEIIARSKR